MTRDQLVSAGWIEIAPGHWHRGNGLQSFPLPTHTDPATLRGGARRELVRPTSVEDRGGPENGRAAAASKGEATGSPSAGASVAVGASLGSGKALSPVHGRAYKRLRQSAKPLLNKLEAEWLGELRKKLLSGTTIWVQALRFRLGNGIWYKPDFAAEVRNDWHDSLFAWEVKGPHVFRGGLENLKVAASLYPEVRWVLAWKEDGLWREQEVLP